MKTVKVSVIIAIYNGEKYLQRCIDSVLGQTYSLIEILLINDGSTDNSLMICQKYATMDSRIRVIDKSNEGESATRNRGLDEAHGEFILFVDQDDFISSSMIEKMVKRIEQDQSDGAICTFDYVDEEEKKLSWKSPCLENRVASGKEIAREYLLTRNIEGFPWNKMFRKSFYFENNITYIGNYPSDMYPSFQLCLFAEKISVMCESLYFYRQCSTSLVHNLNFEKVMGYEETINWIVKLASTCNLKCEADYFYFDRIWHLIFDLWKDYRKDDLFSKQIKRYYSKNKIFESRNIFQDIHKISYYSKITIKEVIKLCIVRLWLREKS